uniref:Transmembrane protein 132E n=1 Tax=Cyanistes caeruleus TaxID=156563 RepID=A0A8C0U8H3_CYACU
MWFQHALDTPSHAEGGFGEAAAAQSCSRSWDLLHFWFVGQKPSQALAALLRGLGAETPLLFHSCLDQCSLLRSCSRGGCPTLTALSISSAAHAKGPAPSPEPAEPPGAILLPVSYRLSNTRLAFFLKELGASPAGNGSAPLQRSEPFVVFQTKELPVLNVTLGSCCQPACCFPQPEGIRGKTPPVPWQGILGDPAPPEGEDPSLTVALCRVKAKKGVNLLSTKSRSGQWLVSSELLTGGKHSTATVDVSRVDGAGPRDGDSSSEIMQLDFEMENFTSQSVTRRIMWHIDYRGRNPPPDLEKVVTELTVIQRDIRAIVPLAMDTEIINTAILTGRTVAIPVKVIAIELSGVIMDVSAMVECKSNNEDIIKVSSSCDYVFVSGKESRGSMSARVTFTYEHLSAPLEMTVWVPKLPLHIELSDARLSQVKGWRVPILPDRRSVRDSEHEEDEDERKQSRGCALQYQHSTLQVFTQFHTTAAEGTGQVVTMLGPDWLVEVTDLVSDFMRIDDPRVAHMVDSSTLAGREPGTTLFKVVSPLVEAVLGETLVTVAEEKVSIMDLKAQVVSSLSLSLHPSPGNSHTIIARTSVQQTLSFFKQEALLSLWISYSDGTTAPLSLYDPKDYNLVVSSLDEKVVSVTQDRAFPLVVAESEGAGELLRVELVICESCQKTKRKSVLFTALATVRVHFGSEEDPTYDYDHVSSRPGLGEAGASTTLRAEVDRKADPSEDGRMSSASHPTEDFPTIPTGFVQVTRGLTDLEIGMYALLGVFCLAILVFLINCIVFVLKYRHKRIPPEGQTNMDHSHHWVFLGNGQPLRAHNDLSPQPESPGNPLENVQTCCHGDHHSSGSSQTSVQSQVHGRGDGSSGGSTRDQSEDPLNSPTSKRKRVKFTTFATMPSDELAYNSIPIADEEDLEWVCQDMGLQDPEELHNYIRRIKEIA